MERESSNVKGRPEETPGTSLGQVIVIDLHAGEIDADSKLVPK
jgi:hypothetical protein